MTEPLPLVFAEYRKAAEAAERAVIRQAATLNVVMGHSEARSIVQEVWGAFTANGLVLVPDSTYQSLCLRAMRSEEAER